MTPPSPVLDIPTYRGRDGRRRGGATRPDSLAVSCAPRGFFAPAESGRRDCAHRMSPPPVLSWHVLSASASSPLGPGASSCPREEGLWALAGEKLLHGCSVQACVAHIPTNSAGASGSAKSGSGNRRQQSREINMTVDRETRFRMSGEKPHAENNGTQGGCCKSLVPAPPHVAALRAARGGESVLQEEAWRPSARCGPVTSCVCHLLPEARGRHFLSESYQPPLFLLPQYPSTSGLERARFALRYWFVASDLEVLAYYWVN